MPSLKRTVTRALVVSLCTLGLPIPAVQAELVATDRVEATRQDGRVPRRPSLVNKGKNATGNTQLAYAA